MLIGWDLDGRESLWSGANPLGMNFEHRAHCTDCPYLKICAGNGEIQLAGCGSQWAVGQTLGVS